jgi:hypothetical protein
MRSNTFAVALLILQVPCTVILWWPVIERIWK